ncbi:seed biotin-containing protein SBP65-like [Quillaja saponaria]|uniref:Seed biotin-containing protein SBP65-like n=1 Tax=Quillaja saponaria TaxID=32244 RepID=A0AAD7VMS7_QUISA|nr:seed biotin-containing protein SBP65-like [Quillaja saponaria]
MASEQMRRENVNSEREIHVEKNRVPKMAEHFEHLAEQAKESDITGGKETPHRVVQELMLVKVDTEKRVQVLLEMQMCSKARETDELGLTLSEKRRKILKRERGRERERREEVGQEEKQGPSPEEISKYRAEAQQNTIGALQSAQERYERAKESACQALGSTTEIAKEKSAKAKDIAAEKAAQAKDIAAEKATQAKDTLASAARTTAEYTSEQAVEASKKTTEKACQVAMDLKDKATAVGWSAAHYTTAIAVDGTKAAARAVEGVAEYTGHKAVEIASKTLDTAKDIASATGEKAKEFTARKKEEAKRELEAKRPSERQGTEWTLTETSTEERFQGSQVKLQIQYENHLKTSQVKVFNVAENRAKRYWVLLAKLLVKLHSKLLNQLRKSQKEGREHGEDTGVLGAIGETLAEIVHTTKMMVIGEDHQGKTGDRTGSRSMQTGKQGTGEEEKR